MKNRKITIRLDCPTFQKLQSVLDSKIEDYNQSSFYKIAGIKKPTISTLVRSAIIDYCDKEN